MSLPQPSRTGTLAVAVSGGQDSLLSLALLRDSGHSLLAVHAFFLPPDQASEERSRRMAEQCRTLDVPYLALDLSRQFEEQVMAPFTAGYLDGLTPNPCALCNPRMKFGMLFDAARTQGAEQIATGHYVRLMDAGHGLRLVRGVDPVKDQSYFLSLTPMHVLERAVFPLGTMHKSQVPGELAARGLTPPEPGESQEICFIPDDDYRAFLRGRAHSLPGPGPILFRGRDEIGCHKGLWNYTLGQRRGLGIAWSEPLYVTGKDVGHNALLVDTRQGLDARGCEASEVNVLVPRDQWPETLLAQTRYKQRATRVRVELRRTSLCLEFLEPHSLPAPGQVAAVYSQAGEVLAGGVIHTVHASATGSDNR